MQAVPTTKRVPARAAPSRQDCTPRRPSPTSPCAISSRARSVELGDRTYVEDARAAGTVSFRQLERAWSGGGPRWAGPGPRASRPSALSIGDPVAFADAFLGAVSAGLWVAPLDPAMPRTAAGGLGRLARTGVGSCWPTTRPRPGSNRVDRVGSSRALRGRARDPARGDSTSARRRGRRRALVVGHHRHAQGGPLEPGELLHTARSVASHLQLESEDRGFNPLPLFHINAEVVGLLSALVAGSSLVLDDRFHRTGFWDLMASRPITWINAVPAIISRLGTSDPTRPFPPACGSSARPRRPAGGRRGPVRGEHRDPGGRDLRDDRGRQPDHRPPLSVPRAPDRWASPSGWTTDRAPDRAGRQPRGGARVPHRPRRDPRRVGDRPLRRRHAPGPLSSRWLAAHGRPRAQGRGRVRLPRRPDRRRHQPGRREGAAPGDGGGHWRRPHGRRRGRGRPDDPNWVRCPWPSWSCARADVGGRTTRPLTPTSGAETATVWPRR